MRILAIRHARFEHLGRISPALKAGGLEFDYLDLYLEPKATCSIASYDGLVLMGGPMSANDNLDYLVRELRIIEDALSAGKPILGICLGAQLIALAAGSRVFPNAEKEIGWAPVYWTDPARQDLLFGVFNRPETVFHWHGETFDLPAGAQWLARSDRCRNQAFRFGSAYGLQFHLEVTPEMISDWVGQEANNADVAGLTDPIEPNQNADRMAELSEIVFGRWCGIVRSSVHRDLTAARD